MLRPTNGFWYLLASSGEIILFLKPEAGYSSTDLGFAFLSLGRR